MTPTTDANAEKGWPNLAFPTLGGKQFWADRFLFGGWRIQENVYTGHSRLLDPSNVRRCWGSYEACHNAFERIRTELRIEPFGEHLVLLIHGLGRSRTSFSVMEKSLRAKGYDVASIAWPTTRRSLADNAAPLEALMESLEGVEQVTFVTHSLGGLLVRELLSRKDAVWRERIAVNAIVMIAPPNQGSAMADRLQYVPPVNLILWRGLFDARTKHVRTLPAPDAPFGIVSAGRGGMGHNPFLKGDDDLIVSTAETELEGAADRMQVNAMHAFVMNDPEVIEATVNFMKHRRFGGVDRQQVN